MKDPKDRRQFWQSHFNRCHQLGMTMKDYAKQEGLTLSVFYGWSKRLKQKAATPVAFARVKIDTHQAQTVTHIPEATGLAQYRLLLPNGLVLECNGESDMSRIVTLVRQLG